MPATPADYESIREAQARARQLQLEAAQLSSGARTFEDDVRSRVNQAMADRGMSTLTQGIGVTTGQLVSEGPSLRERTAMVNPLDVDRMLAAQRAQTLGALTTQAEIQRQREGTISDVIEAGTNQLVAQHSLKLAEAEAAAQEARDIMDFLKLQYTLAGGAEGLGGGNVFDRYGIPVGQHKEITDRLRLLADLKETRGLFGQRERGFLSSLGELTTGPIARLLSPILPGEATRDRLDRLVSDIKKEKYGVAFTDQEMRQSRRWAPSSTKQESTNVKRLDDLIRNKEIELLSILRPYGVSDIEINSLLTTGQAESLNPLLQMGGWSIVGEVAE